MATELQPNPAQLPDSGSPSAAAAAEPTCRECGTTEPWTSSWCPCCGYYPAAGRKLDQKTLESVEEEAPPENTFSVIPAWGWVLAGGVLAILALSVAARFTLPAEGPYRTCWSIVQILIGLGAMSVAHFLAYMSVVTKTDQLSPFEMFFRSFRVWKMVCRKLPASAWLLQMFVWGLTATIAAATLIGGINYLAIVENDWGVEKRAQRNLVHEIVDKAKEEKGEGADSLEDAMNDFTGEGAEDENAENKAVPRVVAECLVVGYTATPDGEVHWLYLASLVNNRLKYVGYITADTLPEQERKKLKFRLPVLKRDKPFVKVPYTGTWLEPRILCEIEYAGLSDEGTLTDPKFRRMLAELSGRALAP
ncbi:MAG: hypothetical protein ACREJB_06310 [Planctomycetaceae bacterium]